MTGAVLSTGEPLPGGAPLPAGTVLTAGTVVADGVVHRPGWVRLDGPLVREVGAGPPPGGTGAPGSVVALGDGAVLVPGFVDTHVHGDFGDAAPGDAALGDAGTDPDAVARVVGLHRGHGTTTMLASLVTAAPADLLAALGALADATEAGLVSGIHLEGPWLSPARAGAHDVALLRRPDPAELAALLAAGRGTVRMVTVAPELPGGLDLVRRVVAAGVVAAVGHTDADAATVRAAVDAGATVVTHLFNAMPQLHHRRPGPVGALLDDPRVTVELVADGVHVDPAVFRLALAAAGPGRVSLVSDAMAAAGSVDGRYRLGSMDVVVADGVARTAGSGSIAGSTATADALFRWAVRHARAGTSDADPHAGAGPADAGTDPVESLVLAATMTSATPARALGLAGVGRLAPGHSADLVVLGPGLHVDRVMRAGRWLAPPG